MVVLVLGNIAGQVKFHGVSGKIQEKNPRR